MKRKSFQDIRWKQCYDELSRKQEFLVENYRQGNSKKVNELQKEIVTSFATRALAVKKVTTNHGSKTPGVDGVTWTTSIQKMDAIDELRHWTQKPREYTDKPVRRVMIPKPGIAEKRPLGIPTLLDRAMQAVYKEAIDPIVEEQSDPNSYGFRKYRGCREAIAMIRTLLAKEHGASWILDADIEKCFDRINHQWLIQNVPMIHKEVLESWLKSGVSIIRETQAKGTPPLACSESKAKEGGIISPLLCNICLNGMEIAVKNVAKGTGLRYPKIHVIRYADDFLVTGSNEAGLANVEKAVQKFLEPRGLRLHPEKTRRVHIEKQTVEFLGFEIFRRDKNFQLNMPSLKGQNTKALIIRPTKTKVSQLKAQINQILKKRGPIGSIIRNLNPKLIGWANYFRVARTSMKTFSKLNNWLWFKMLAWAKGKHRGRSSEWLVKRYTSKSDNRTHQWGLKKKTETIFLVDVGTITYQFVPNLQKQLLNPYVQAERYQLEQRAFKISIGTKKDQAVGKALLVRDGSLCLVCGRSLLETYETVEIHHIRARKSGGDWKLNNLALLHYTCHKLVTYDQEENARISKLINPSKTR